MCTKEEIESMGRALSRHIKYERIKEAVDIGKLDNTHIVAVGAGGAFGLYESLLTLTV